MSRARVYDALAVLWERQQASEHGWVLEGPERISQREGVAALERSGLAELADRVVRAELSAWEGRPVRWAARLTSSGRDVLAYHRHGPAPTRPEPGPGQTLVELRSAQMDVARVFVSLADHLRVPPADGLAEQVRAAVHDRALARWLLCLTRGQMESLAYGLWLHGITRSVAEANRFGREYGIVYRPAGSGPPATAPAPRRGTDAPEGTGASA
ncbi:DUF6417 family protein [Streptomyces griseosporeus]|uniref:DUF6417 family protein n=1 Tax=Streptomyces griseosporeus TaxID=1910 RepID=UPI0037A712A1